MKTKLLDMLWSVPSISGEELQFSNMLNKYLNMSGAWKETDTYGNLYYGVGNYFNPDIVLIAHMDDIGLVVSSITVNGMLVCCPRGLIYPINMEENTLDKSRLKRHFWRNTPERTAF